MPKITKISEETKDEKRRDRILIAGVVLILLIFFTMLLTSTFAKEIYDKISDQIIEVLDLHKPTAPKIDTDNKTWTKEALVKVIKDATAKDGLDYYEYCVSGEKSTKKCDWKKTTTKNAIISDSGEYYVVFRAIDKEGRKGDNSNQVQVYVDNNNPQINKVEVTELDNNKITILTTAIDEHSGIEKYQYSINDSEYKDGTLTNTFTDLKDDTTYKIAVKVIDKVGNETVYTADITTKKINNDTGDIDNPQDNPVTDNFDIPVINLDKVPTTFSYGDSYSLPSYYSFGNDTGVVSCIVEGKEYTDTKDLTIGKHLIVCTATSSHNKRVMVEKEVNIKPRTAEDELLDGWIILNLYYPANSTNWEWRLGKTNTVRTGNNNDGWQPYTGPIMVRITDVENVYIRYDMNGETVIDAGNGKVVIDIEPDKYSVKDNEQANIKINYDKRCSNKKYKINGGVWQDYTQSFSVGKNTLVEAECLVLEDIYDSDGNFIYTSKRTGYDGVYISEYIEPSPSGTPGGYDPTDPTNPEGPGGGYTPIVGPGGIQIPTPTVEILNGPIINHTPETLTDEVTVTITTEYPSEKVYYRFGTSGPYQEYINSFKVNENTIITAYYVRQSDGKVSNTTYHYIQNIKKPNMPYVRITASPDAYLTTNVEEVEVTIIGNDCNKLEYSLDGVIYKTYTSPLTIKQSSTIYAKGTNNNGTTIEQLQIPTITPPKEKEKLNISINLLPDKNDIQGLANKTTATINYDPKATDKYYSLGSSGNWIKYTGPITITENTTIYAYATSNNGEGNTSKAVTFLTTGISDPIINVSTTNPTQQVKVEIEFDPTAEVTRYRVGNTGTFYDYNGPFYVYENTTIYAYNSNSLGYDATTSKKINNIVAGPSYLAIDKGKYIILKPNYPEQSDKTTWEYKWKKDGTWKPYDSKGILLIKAEYKNEFMNGIQDGIKVEDEKGKTVIFTDHYYILDVPMSELSENLFMRWDTVKPNAPSIITSTQDPDKEVTVGISYSSSLSKKYYRVVTPTNDTGWLEYDKPFKVTENNTTIYAKGTTSQEIDTEVANKTITNIDEVAPTVSVQGDTTNPKQQVTLKLIGKDNLGIDRVAWIKGSKTKEECSNNGNNIPNNSTFTVTENDTYTICAIDKVGNSIKDEIVINNIDTNAPDISINVETTNLSKEIIVSIDYGDSTVKEYKIGNNDTYKTYTNTITIKGEDVQNLKNSDGSITIYAKGKDTASNETIVTETTYVLDTDLPNAPIINATAGYPILTEYGVKLNEKSSIVFDPTRDDITNYYSIDNGTTWKVYKGPFDITSGTIMAKSVKNDTGLTVTASKNVTQPSDALGPNAYDGNMSTYIQSGIPIQKLNIDSSINGKAINVNAYTYFYLSGSNASYIFFTFKDEIGTTVGSQTLSGNTNHDINITVPENAKTLEIQLLAYSQTSKLYEVSVQNAPILKEEFEYPKLTENGIENGYSNVEIEYFPTAIERLYKINDGEWTKYENKKIKLEYNDIIYAKSIDKDGQESKILTYTVSSKDALGINAYDGNMSTYIQSGIPIQKLNIDSSMNGKAINVNAYTYFYLSGSNASYIFFTFKDEIGTTVGSQTLSGNTNHDINITVPENAKTLEIQLLAYSQTSKLYEIYPSPTPVITQINHYPVLLGDEIETNYIEIKINYLSNTTNRQYSLDNGTTWKNYTGSFKVENGMKILAKAIDKNGEPTDIATYNVVDFNDYIGINSYDTDYETIDTIDANTNKSFVVDSSSFGKKLRVYLANSPATNGTISIYDKNNNLLDDEKLTEIVSLITIPTKAYKVTITSGSSNLEISEINARPVLSTSPVENPLININYNGWARNKTVDITYAEGYTNQYSLDLGETWLDYTLPITLDKPTLVIARSLDNNKVVASSTFNVTRIDNVDAEIYFDFGDKVGLGIDKKLPSRAKLGLSSSEPICKIGDDVVTSTMDLELGTYTVECSTTNGMNVTTTVSKTFEIVEAIPIEGESILSILEEDLDEGLYEFIVDDESYTVHLYVLEGNQTFTEDKIFGNEKDIATGTNIDQMAKNMVIVKVKGDLTINEGVTVKPISGEYGGPKGFTLYVTGNLTNKGTIENRAGAAAKNQKVYLWKNADGTYEYIGDIGTEGGEVFTFNGNNWQAKSGNKGADGTGRSLGGGGTGGAYTCYANGTVGAGSSSSTYAGGAGGGGVDARYASHVGGSAVGLIGGNGATPEYQVTGGGAGMPGGKGSQITGNGENVVGGLLIIYSNTFNNTSTGKVDATGGKGGSASAGGGSSGGGSINIFTNQPTNINQLGIETDVKYNEILGNASAQGGEPTGTAAKGGAGGNGTVNIGEIRNGQYYDLKRIIEQDKDAYKASITKTGDSILSILEDNTLKSGYYAFKVKDEEYSVHLYVLEGNQTFTEDKIFGELSDCATGTSGEQLAKNMVIVKVKGNLTINEGVTVKPISGEYGGPKGFTLYVTGNLTNKGTIENRAGATAENQKVYLWKNADGTYEYIGDIGTEGGEVFTFNGNNWQAKSGNKGADGTGRSLGGGGTGGAYTCYANGTVGAGSSSSTYAGGAGGGGVDARYASHVGGSAVGLIGGNGATPEYQVTGGGAGMPGGKGSQITGNGENIVGGLLIIYSNTFNNTSTGKVDATGGKGGSVSAGGGSSGGGSINIFTKQPIEVIIDRLDIDSDLRYNEIIGNITAQGGEPTGTVAKGGAGGNGTINIGEIHNGQYYGLKDKIADEQIAYRQRIIKNGESILSILKDDSLKSGYYFFRVKDEEYPVHLYVLEGNQTFTEDKIFGDSSDCASGTLEEQMAQNMVIVKVKGNLTINSGVTVRPYYDENYGGPKGFTLYVTGKLTNNGTIDNSHGAYAYGQNVYLWKNTNGSYEYVPAVGAQGAAAGTESKGNSGSNGINRQTGGGGSGNINYYGFSNTAGSTTGVGGNGTSYSGGTGSGGLSTTTGKIESTAGNNHGGSGGNANTGSYSYGGRNANGGTGNPGGMGSQYNASAGLKGTNGTGGLLIIYTNELINNNIISANGTSNHEGSSTGGSSGGGSINIFYNTLNSKGTTSVIGGTTGGAGGNGTVTYTQISF